MTQVQEATVAGQLFDLLVGYPALTPGNGLVSMAFCCRLSILPFLSLLDRLEDYDPHRPPDQNTYLRVKTKVFSLSGQSLGSAWIYQMQPERSCPS